MKKTFEVNVTDEDRQRFATLSGDFNPLHVDLDYAKQTNYLKPVMHGAFHAGLISRMAGMYLPGKECILYDIKVRFIKPLFTPATLKVLGEVLIDNGMDGAVKVTITDKVTSAIYAEGEYKFGRHKAVTDNRTGDKNKVSLATSEQYELLKDKFLVTGASGGIGSAICNLLGNKALPITRDSINSDGIRLGSYSNLLNWDFSEVSGIIHCAWPMPIETSLLDSADLEVRLDYEILKPINDIISLAKLLKKSGKHGAKIILIGSTWAEKGSHSWRKPGYSLSKSLVPNLVNILATELAATYHCAIGVEFDLVNGGMNSTLSERQIASAANKKINGKITEAEEVASHVKWILDNDNTLLSGSIMQLGNTYKN